MTTKHTPTPWEIKSSAFGDTSQILSQDGQVIASVSVRDRHLHVTGDAAFIVRACNAHDDLLAEASVLRCLATSPRFQRMTVADALAELKANGCGHDDGAAIAKARGC